MNQTADLTEKTLSREEKYQGSFLSLHVDQVQLPNGRTSFREVVEHVDGVAILALDDRNNVLTVTQYRYVIGKTLLEIPAGKLEPGEDPVAGALRELKEETGCHITFINLSGGVGVPYRPEQPANDIAAIGAGVRKAYEEILVPAGMGDVSLCTELGRFMLAPYGHLVTRVLHQKHTYKEYVGVDACASNLMRPAIYGAYHHITVMGKEDVPCDHKYDVTGSLCENSDKFAIDRMLPEVEIGDLLVIHDTGAHGHAMGYQYNGRLRSAEVLLQEDGSARLIRRAETPEDYFATAIWE